MKCSVAIIALLLCAATAEAATIRATSCERSAVAAAVNTARDGDTVTIPAGRCTWTSTLMINGKFLTLQGAGIDATTIVDGVSKDPYPNTPYVLWIHTKSGGLTRVTGITFQGGSITGPYTTGLVQITGNSKSWRLDHCEFVATKTAGLFVYGFTFGVIDHNVFDLRDWRYGIYTFHHTWNGKGSYGDGSWADATYLGTEKAIFIEDNVFKAPNLSVAHDGWSGGRVVFRHNHLLNTVYANHGTESGGRLRGQRSFEIYENTIRHTAKGYPAVVGLRSGVGVVFNNKVTFEAPAYITRVVDAQVFRANQGYAPWGKCDGTSLWDGNDVVGGYPCLDQIGRGQSTLISGDTPLPLRWPDQRVEPTYAWNNTLNGVVSPMFSVSTRHIKAGRDFFNAPKPGYVPYVYPHPLSTGTGVLAAPGNLQVR